MIRKLKWEFLFLASFWLDRSRLIKDGLLHPIADVYCKYIICIAALKACTFFWYDFLPSFVDMLIAYAVVIGLFAVSIIGILAVPCFLGGCFAFLDALFPDK